MVSLANFVHRMDAAFAYIRLIGDIAAAFILLPGKGVEMPADDIFQNTPFDDEQIEVMSAVFERATQGLDRADEGRRDLVANAILKCAWRGIFDPFEMRKRAHEVLHLG